MKSENRFELLEKRTIAELNTQASLFRHVKTGAEVLSMSNDDSNKVFAITFRTPPADSTGIAHILEHSVLCGSRKYPVKEPFVELLKGSLQTFLNAFTYPDKTCYPVASQNLKDFYNLIDVYLDAVFYPRLTPLIFQQEGWHYELEETAGALSYKGVVFNEMKGVYSSPESLLAQFTQQSLFPDITYGLESGGSPLHIPDLTYEQFKTFHSRYYHPSNSRIFFYGDDDPEERLVIIDRYLNDFEPIEPDSSISLQPRFNAPQETIRTFPASDETGNKGMVTVNWLLSETSDIDTNMALRTLEYILIGMPASPLRKALIESGLGDGIAGVGLEAELRQLYFSAGLKGVDIENAGKVESLILETLSNLADQGIDARTVDAAMNTIEFRLRENNSGRFPLGLMLMLRSLTSWLYGRDPFALLAFEAPLTRLKSRLQTQDSFFENMIKTSFVENLHRTTVLLKPEPGQSQKEDDAEKERISNVRESMTPEALQNVIDTTKQLKEMQQAPDSPEALASIPNLQLSDIDREAEKIPIECSEKAGAELIYHDLFTNGIFYFDVGLDLHLLPGKYLPYVKLFGRALLEMGTDKEDYVSLSQRIGRKTGGIRTSLFTSTVNESDHGAARLFLRGKATVPLVGDMLDIISDILMRAKLDDSTRFKQILLEEKAAQEHSLIPGGHHIVGCRVRAHFNEADWAEEQMSGISYLFFLRELDKKIDDEWEEVSSTLHEIRRLLLNRSAAVLNVTVDEKNWGNLEGPVLRFLDVLPQAEVQPAVWSVVSPQNREGMVVPSRVNYVGKGADLYELGYDYSGSVHVITHFLRTSWLWDQVRVQGGAYGAMCAFDRLSGGLTFVSYRDPNLLQTLDAFDRTAAFLSDLALERAELTQSIIGAIGDIDPYRLPDAKGFTSLQRHLIGVTDESRQRIRDEVLSTTQHDFKSFAEILQQFKEHGIVKVLGSESSIRQANETHGDFLTVFNVL